MDENRLREVKLAGDTLFTLLGEGKFAGFREENDSQRVSREGLSGEDVGCTEV